MLTIEPILLILAFALFVAATFGVTSKVNLTAAGLACYVLTYLV